jgi:hypothetical protein
MALPHVISQLRPRSQLTPYLVGGLATFSAFAVLRTLKTFHGLLTWEKFKPIPPPNPPKEELAQLPYPPDALPGARDVDSPYGTTRVYEWGPEDGPKVLLIHGISTPSIALADLAHRLVAKGYRVMLFGTY